MHQQHGRHAIDDRSGFGLQLFPMVHVAQECLKIFIQGQGAADGTGQLVGNGALDSEDGEFTGTGTFTGVGDCEGATVATY